MYSVFHPRAATHRTALLVRDVHPNDCPRPGQLASFSMNGAASLNTALLSRVAAMIGKW
jgi:hypothetical protein